MTCANLSSNLRKRIKEQLSPLITADYWLMEIPHYDNVGDTLIWQGELDFLSRLPYRCKGMRALDSWQAANINENDLVLFQGGGNFGDLWSKHHDFKMRIMAEHPKNRFLFFPQTVYFEKEGNMRKCAEFMSNFNAIICTRDKVSFDLLKSNFRNDILLVPDMAFYMDMQHWLCKKYTPKKKLLLKRTDKEFKSSETLDVLSQLSNLDISDWTTMAQKGIVDKFLYPLQMYSRLLRWLYNPFMYYIYRPYLIHSGVKQIMQHTDVYTTRLHTCILSILLNKENIVLFDNSYGKNKNFYETWLSECSAVRMATP